VYWTLYIYFGMAVLVGIFAGAGLSYTNTFLVHILGASKEAEVRGRTLAAYRREKREKQVEKAKLAFPRVVPPISAPLAAEWMKQDYGPESAGLLSTTIMEEDDSSGAGF